MQQCHKFVFSSYLRCAYFLAQFPKLIDAPFALVETPDSSVTIYVCPGGPNSDTALGHLLANLEWTYHETCAYPADRMVTKASNVWVIVYTFASREKLLKFLKNNPHLQTQSCQSTDKTPHGMVHRVCFEVQGHFAPLYMESASIDKVDRWHFNDAVAAENQRNKKEGNKMAASTPTTKEVEVIQVVFPYPGYLTDFIAKNPNITKGWYNVYDKSVRFLPQPVIGLEKAANPPAIVKVPASEIAEVERAIALCTNKPTTRPCSVEHVEGSTFRVNLDGCVFLAVRIASEMLPAICHQPKNG